MGEQGTCTQTGLEFETQNADSPDYYQLSIFDGLLRVGLRVHRGMGVGMVVGLLAVVTGGQFLSQFAGQLLYVSRQSARLLQRSANSPNTIRHSVQLSLYFLFKIHPPFWGMWWLNW